MLNGAAGLLGVFYCRERKRCCVLLLDSLDGLEYDVYEAGGGRQQQHEKRRRGCAGCQGVGDGAAREQQAAHAQQTVQTERRRMK